MNHRELSDEQLEQVVGGCAHSRREQHYGNHENGEHGRNRSGRGQQDGGDCGGQWGWQNGNRQHEWKPDQHCR